MMHLVGLPPGHFQKPCITKVSMPKMSTRDLTKTEALEKQGERERRRDGRRGGWTGRVVARSSLGEEDSS